MLLNKYDITFFVDEKNYFLPINLSTQIFGQRDISGEIHIDTQAVQTIFFR